MKGKDLIEDMDEAEQGNWFGCEWNNTLEPWNERNSDEYNDSDYRGVGNG